MWTDKVKLSKSSAADEGSGRAKVYTNMREQFKLMVSVLLFETKQHAMSFSIDLHKRMDKDFKMKFGQLRTKSEMNQLLAYSGKILHTEMWHARRWVVQVYNFWIWTWFQIFVCGRKLLFLSKSCREKSSTVPRQLRNKCEENCT